MFSDVLRTAALSSSWRLGAIITYSMQHADIRAWRWLPSSSETRDILWWYTTNLIAVCVFKSIHFASVYRQGLFAAAGIQSSGAVEHTINTALVFATDAFQVGVIVLIVFLIARRLLGMSFNILMLLTTLMILFIGVGNALSLSELGSKLSLETLLLSIDWIRSDPSIITEYIGRRNILGAAILTGWYSIPFITSRLEAHDGGGDSAR